MRIERQQIETLAKSSVPESVSLWMPVHGHGPEAKQNPIRMKNLLSKAEQQLTAVGGRSADARDRLTAVRAVVEDNAFWRMPAQSARSESIEGQDRSESLGVLLADGKPAILRLPVAVPILVMVSDHLYVKPLFDIALQDKPFYVLALSQNTVQLFHANRFAVASVPLPLAPQNFEEYQRVYDFERHVDFHTGSAVHQPDANRPAVFHGQGGASDEAQEKKRLAGFCRRVDEQVVRLIHKKPAPLFIAATEPLQSLYRQVSSCSHLDQRAVQGNPDEATKEDLHRQAVSVLAKDFDRPIRDLLDRFGQARSTGLVMQDLEAVLRAASVHAVEALLVRSDQQCWGRFDAEEGTVIRHDAQQAGDEDLINRAAVLACRGGAIVHAIEQEHMPNGALVAALLRFQPAS